MNSKKIYLDKKTLCLYIGNEVFPLIPTTAEEIGNLRAKKCAAFIYKKNGALYYTKIPKSLSLLGAKLLGNHLCAADKNVCSHLSAASDEDGGCEKVRNFSQGIENFSFILTGYETINTITNAFTVSECINHVKTLPREIAPGTKKQLLLSLAHFAYDDIPPEDIKARNKKYQIK